VPHPTPLGRILHSMEWTGNGGGTDGKAIVVSEATWLRLRDLREFGRKP